MDMTYIDKGDRIAYIRDLELDELEEVWLSIVREHNKLISCWKQESKNRLGLLRKQLKSIAFHKAKHKGDTKSLFDFIEKYIVSEEW